MRGRVTEAHRRRMLEGVPSPVGRLRAVAVQLRGGTGPKSRLEVTLDEGRNRHIRRMLAALRDESTGAALKVLELKRVAFGGLKLDVPSGGWRELTPEEVRALDAPAA